MAQLDGFTAAGYRPRAWADLFARAGARYIFLTTRHHGGVALWDTAHGGLNVRHAPAARDLVGPYAGVLWIDPPGVDVLGEHASVLAVEPDGGLDLYRRAGRF